MNFIELTTAANFKITGAEKYQWHCFGNQAHYIEFNNIISAIFDTQNQMVYAVEIIDESNNMAWQYIDPDFKQKYIDECKSKNVDPNMAYDNCKFQQVDFVTTLTLVNQICKAPL